MLRLAVIIASATATLLAATTAGAQPPSPLAIKRADFDGDGKTDEVRVSRLGTIEVLFAKSKKTTANRFSFETVSGPKKARIDLGSNRVLVVAEGADGAGEALWLKLDNKRASVLWRGLLEAKDEDTGTRRKLEVIGRDLYRYYDNPSVRRCDGKPARIDTETLKGTKFVATHPPSEIEVGAQAIAATASPPAGTGAAVRATTFRPRATSSQRGTVSADLLGEPVSLGDDDPRTEWVEGRAGSGRGEFVSLRSSAAEKVVALRVISGSGRSAADFSKHNRPRRLGLVFDSGDKFWIELAETTKAIPQWVVLPRPITASCATLILDTVSPASNQRRDRGQTALSEVSVFTEIELSGDMESTLVERILAGDRAGQARRALRKLGAPAVKALLARLGKGDLKGRQMLSLRRVLASLGAAPTEVAAALGQREATERDRAELTESLRAMGPAALPALVELVANTSASESGRRGGARLIGGSAGAPALAALLELAQRLGDAPTAKAQRAVRAEIARALGRRPVSAFSAIAAAASKSSGPAVADLYRAIGLMARRSREQAAMTEATSLLANALSNDLSYESQYRLLVALAGLPTSEAIGHVRSRLEALGSSNKPNDIALRRVSTAALGENPDPAAHDALLVSTRDTDVGVRELGVSALAERSGSSSSDAPLGALLGSDPWPSVRRGAAGALAARCDRPGPLASLRAAASSENDVRVGQVVLSSVVRCASGEAADILFAVAGSAKRPVALRAHALTLLGQIHVLAVSDKLIALYERFVADSINDADAITLAEASAGGLCVSKNPKAVDALIDATTNSAYSEIQAASVRALGCHCSPKSAPLLRKLTVSTKTSVSIAARRAIESCKRKPTR